MIPALPSLPCPRLETLALEVLGASAALGKGLHPFILEEIGRLMLKVNSYYTNAMEGNPSRLADIDAALDKRFAKDAAARNFQREHLAHIEVQRAALARVAAEPALSVCSEEFLCWLHERFFMALPPELRFARTLSGATVPVEPGRLRERGVSVGRHEGPETLAEVRGHLRRFEELLDPGRLEGAQRLIGFASSHHRLLWIHPFSEGNGRVARLMTTAYGFRVGLGSGQLWTVSRAFARRRAEYDEHLALADRPRRNDLDGRGPLSEEDLVAFCEYFLGCCLDQVRFMADKLALAGLERRYGRHLARLVEDGSLSKSGAKVMERLLLLGEVPRGSVRELCGVGPRRASQVVRELLAAGLVRSLTPYGALRLDISAEMSAVLFPELA